MSIEQLVSICCGEKLAKIIITPKKVSPLIISHFFEGCETCVIYFILKYHVLYLGNSIGGNPITLLVATYIWCSIGTISKQQNVQIL